MAALSIAICTYNRAEGLRGMLQSLAMQDVSDIEEVVIVDNGSTDHTKDVTRSFGALPVRYVFESQQGLSHARNCALASFAGAHLLFFDDDVRLGPDCVAQYVRAIDAFPDADYFGGRILPDWPNGAPAWARAPLPLIDGLLVWHDLGMTSRRFTTDDAGPFGASFALSRKLIEQVGQFDVALGCIGARRGRGEETEWFGRARKLGASGVYVGEALCHHRVDPARLGLSKLFNYGVESGAAHRLITGADTRGSPLRLCAFALRGAVQMLKGHGDRARQCVINMGMEYDALRR